MKLSEDPKSWIGKKLTFTTTRSKRTEMDKQWGMPIQGLRNIVKEPDKSYEFIVIEIIDQSKEKKIIGTKIPMKVETSYSNKVRLVKTVNTENGAISVFPIGYIAAGIVSGSIRLSESRSGNLIGILEWFQR